MDKRGGHPPKNKIPDESRQFVINHIKSFPRYKSHYSQQDNPNTRYLSPVLNIKRLYKLCVERSKEENKIPVKESYYRKVFNCEFHLRFHRPHSDTCDKCDKLNNLIKIQNNVSSDRAKLELEEQEHQKRAETALN